MQTAVATQALLGVPMKRISFMVEEGDKDEEKMRRAMKENEIQLERPIDEFAKPTEVYPWWEITLQEINTKDQTFKTSIEMHTFWVDPHLPMVWPKYKTKPFIVDPDYLPIKLEEIFENKLDCTITKEPVYKYYESTGVVHMFMIVECFFAERMELQTFPLDRQFLNMEFNGFIEPEQEGAGDWKWILEFPKWLDDVPESEIPDRIKKNKPNIYGKDTWSPYDQTFAVRMLSSITEYESLVPWVDFSGIQDEKHPEITEPPLVVELRVNRKPKFYFCNIALPNFLIVGGCFGAYPIPRTDVADRLSVTVTLMLAAVAFRFVITEYLPKVAYLTYMDKYLLTGFVALILLIAENAFVGSSILKPKTADVVDDLAFGLFGGIWCIIHIIISMALVFPTFGRPTWEEQHILDNEADPDADFEHGGTIDGDNSEIHYRDIKWYTKHPLENWTDDQKNKLKSEYNDIEVVVKKKKENDDTEIKYDKDDDTVMIEMVDDTKSAYTRAWNYAENHGMETRGRGLSVKDSKEAGYKQSQQDNNNNNNNTDDINQDNEDNDKEEQN